jgi:hypothetical protein
MEKINNRRDILLLFLFSPGKTNDINESIIGRTRLTKTLFLFKEEALPYFSSGTNIDKENFYEFFSWNFGPFSSQVYEDLNFFILRQFISTSNSKNDISPESVEELNEWIDSSGIEVISNNEIEYLEEEFQLTKKGIDWVGKNLYNELSNNQKKILQDFKAKMQITPIKAILRYVYEKYPEYTNRSIIKDKILGKSV